jgi:tetratricopeptide (TPR) repeat protein
MNQSAERFCPSIFILLGCLIVGVSGLAAQENWPAVIQTLKQQIRSNPGDQNLQNQLAIAHNNYAMTLGDQKKWEEATRQMEEALRLDRQNTRFKENLSLVHLNHAYQLYQEPNRTHSYQSYRHLKAKGLVEKALRSNSKLAPAYLLLGDIEYDNQQLPKAERAWQKAQKLDPRMDGLASRLDRVGRESKVESDMNSVADLYFTLRYDDSVKRSTGFDIRRVLQEARLDVGRDFQYRPKHKIVVLLYSKETFRKVRQGAPEWLAGMFDGKIRLPIPESERDLGSVRGTVVHEYTHAVVHELSGGRVPHWFNEGLAEYQETKFAKTNKPASSLEQALNADELLPWNQIESLFGGRSTDQVRLGYDQSHSVVAYLAQRYGFWHIPRLLTQMAQGASFEEALEQEFKSPAERLEKDWKRWLPRFF